MPAAADGRWPYWPKLGLLIAEIVLSLIVLGLYADLQSLVSSDASDSDPIFWWISFGLTTAILAFLASIFLLVTFLVSLICSPLIALIIDAVLVVFYFITLVGTGVGEGSLLGDSCTYTDYVYTYTSTVCGVEKGAFAMVLIAFLVFIASLVLSAITFHRERKGLLKTHANPNVAFASGAVAEAPPGVSVNQMQQAGVPMTPQSYTPAPSQYMQSPVPTPAPNYEQQVQHMQSPAQTSIQPTESTYR